MKFLSVCSGIEAASVAFRPLGWKAWAFSEIEPFPSAVLAHHYPDIPNLGDMTNYEEWPNAAIDLLCGGTPCQSFSVAGLRRGLADERGSLSLTFCKIADKYDPEWVLWENVPGVLSSKDNAFGCFLAGLVGADEPFDPRGRWPKWGVVTGPKRTAAWRVLDAQFFGVPQRRRRVFVLASRGFRDWRSAAALFPVGESMFWNSPPRRKAGEGAPHDVAPSLTSSGRGVERTGESRGQDPVIGCWWDGGQVSQTLDAVLYKGQTMPEKNRFPAALQPVAFDSRQDPVSSTERFGSLGSSSPQAQAVAVSLRGREGGGTAELSGDVSTALRASQGGGDKPHVLSQMAVRRLTPRECERLQGFPDDYTRIPTWNGWRDLDAGETPEGLMAEGLKVKQSKKTGRWRVRDVDGPRYKALGNSMAVPVMRWIGERIQNVDQIHNKENPQ